MTRARTPERRWIRGRPSTCLIAPDHGTIPPDTGTGADARSDSGTGADGQSDTGTAIDVASDATQGTDSASDASQGTDSASDSGTATDSVVDDTATDTTTGSDTTQDSIAAPDVMNPPDAPSNGLSYNNGQISCFGTTCAATGSTPQACCDERIDGGYVDQCVTGANMCTASGAKFVECTDNTDCSGGASCCGTFGVSSSGTAFFSGSVCAATCATGTTQMCVMTADCTSGSCVPATISGRTIGRCM